MSTATEPRTEWNVLDVFRRFGPMPIRRIRREPEPGTATEAELIATNDRKKSPLCEFVDGILVEKASGWPEAYLALEIGRVLGNFVRAHRLGVVVGPDGMYRLKVGLVRLPDISFIAHDRFPKNSLPSDPICKVIPNLAVEVLSKGNTKKEMAEKLQDYFQAGVQLVWYVDPAKKTVRVYTSPHESRVVRESGSIDGGTVLPGFTLQLRELFADPLAGTPSSS